MSEFLRPPIKQPLKKECCVFCAPHKMSVCANTKDGRSVEFNLSNMDDVKAEKRNISVEQCYKIMLTNEENEE